MDGSIDFQPYLSSICRHYASWWAEGVLTDSERQQEEPFNFDLQAKEIKTKPGRTSTPEEFNPPLPVIKALHQLVEPKKQILLVGQPGAGKTKTLWRYLLELAEQAKQDPSAKIPILIRLKDYQTSSDGKHSGLIHLIRKELIFLEPEEIERCLFLELRFILLIDGLNESTSPELRKDLQQFLNNCRRCQVPIVFTTRSLGYRNLEIETQLELQPISPEERQRFLNDRVSPSNQQKLRGWLERAHQSNYTPFVLWMLAEVCQQTNSSSQIAETFSLGEAFQEFIRLYQDRLYEEGRVSEEDRDSWNSQLKQLAFEMLSDEASEEHFIVSRRKAINVLKSEALLNGLISHHLLIERRDNGKIEFCHQLLQEYYVAEWLFDNLSKFTPEQLKYYFLNYLKWTEAIALMLGLPELADSVVIHIVKLALQEIDLMLGVRLAAGVKLELQSRISNLFDLYIPQLLRMRLNASGTERRNIVLRDLLSSSHIIMHLDTRGYISELANKASIFFGNIDSQKVSDKEFESLISLLTDDLSRHCDYIDEVITDEIEQRLSEAKDKIDGEVDIAAFISRLNDPDDYVRRIAAEVLGEIGGEPEVLTLILALNDQDAYVRWITAESIGNIGSPKFLPNLWKLQMNTAEIFILNAIEAIQVRYGFYNYKIATSDPPSPINFKELLANNSPTYNFYGSVGNVAYNVHGDQISNQAPSLNSKQLATNYSDSTIQAKDVLEIIFNGGEQLERSSREVRSLSEESLRDWFIHSINGKYPGLATGETWNKDGKTDILVRLGVKNVLIAECKFWGGEKKLKETLDQLLRYATVRDTQIAILIFSRNKDFTNVKQSIPQAMKQHSSFGREISIDLEKAWYEYVVFHPDDRACELTLTIFAFHLPK